MATSFNVTSGDPPTSTTLSSHNDPPLGDGAIAGIAIGIGLIVVAFAFMFGIWIKRRRKNHEANEKKKTLDSMVLGATYGKNSLYAIHSLLPRESESATVRVTVS
jgi:hypothetical protein